MAILGSAFMGKMAAAQFEYRSVRHVATHLFRTIGLADVDRLDLLLARFFAFPNFPPLVER